jgi:hypothetical protein
MEKEDDDGIRRVFAEATERGSKARVTPKDFEYARDVLWDKGFRFQDLRGICNGAGLADLVRELDSAHSGNPLNILLKDSLASFKDGMCYLNFIFFDRSTLYRYCNPMALESSLRTSTYISHIVPLAKLARLVVGLHCPLVSSTVLVFVRRCTGCVTCLFGHPAFPIFSKVVYPRPSLSLYTSSSWWVRCPSLCSFRSSPPICVHLTFRSCTLPFVCAPYHHHIRYPLTASTHQSGGCHFSLRLDLDPFVSCLVPLSPSSRPGGSPLGLHYPPVKHHQRCPTDSVFNTWVEVSLCALRPPFRLTLTASPPPLLGTVDMNS